MSEENKFHLDEEKIKESLNKAQDFAKKGIEKGIESAKGAMNQAFDFGQNVAKDPKAAAQEVKEKVLTEGKKAAAEAEKTGRKAAETAKKAGAEAAKRAKTLQVSELVLEYQGMSISEEEIVARVKADYAARYTGTPVSLKLYLKPEEHAVYYVAGDEKTGKIDL